MIEYVLIGKMLAPFASKAAAAGLQRLLSDRKAASRIAADVSRATRDEFPASKRRLKRVLRRPELVAALSNPDQAQGLSDAVQLFEGEFRQQRNWRGVDDDESQQRCLIVAEKTVAVLLRHLPTGDGLNVLDARAAARSAAAEKQLASIEQALSGSSLLDQAVLPETVSAEIRALVDETPVAVALVQVLTTAPEPDDDLAAWLEQPPAWLETPLGWICVGLSLEVLSRPELAAQAILRGVAEGQGSRRRWEGHAARLLMGTSPEKALDIVQSHTDGLGAVIKAAIAEDYEATLTALEGWDPSEDLDRDIKAIMTGSALQLLDSETEAIRVLRARRPLAIGTTVSLRLARILVAQAYRGRALSRDDQLREAADIALEVRDRRRRWRGNTVEAILVAADAFGLLHDWGEAWRLLRSAPEGNATDAEAADPKLKERAITAAVGLGDLDLARQLSEEAGIGTAYVTAFAGAVQLEAKDDITAEDLAAAREAWRVALVNATDDMQAIWAAHRLLICGGSDPAVDELRERAPDVFAEIDEVIAALDGAETQISIARLRGIRRENRFAAMALADLYNQQGRRSEMIDVLTEAADSFDDQHLRLMAASHLASRGDHQQAADLARDALDKAGPSWNGRRQAQEIILENLSLHGAWAEFISTARRYLAEQDNPRVRWALAFALAREADLEPAWRAITDAPDALHPLEPAHAQLYLELASKFGSRAQLVRDAVTALKRFGMDNEAFAAGVFSTVLTKENTQISEEDQLPAEAGELSDLMQRFFDRYPDSNLFVEVPFDPDDPVGSIEAIAARLRPGHGDLVRLEEDIAVGRLPTGVLTSVLGKRYAEGFLRLAGGGLRVRSPQPDQRDTDRADARAFLGRTDRRTLVDASALHTCTLLPDAIRDNVLAAHPRLLMTRESVLDIRVARDSMSLQATGWMGLDRSGAFYITETSDEWRVTVRSRSQLMLDLAQAADFIASVVPESDEDAARFQPWLYLGPTAAEAQAFFWCDDSALRTLARAGGVATFGTLELIDALVHAGKLSTAQRDETQIALIGERVFDLELDPEILKLQAEKDGWRADGAAAATLTRPATWTHSRLGFGLMQDAINSNAATPNQMEGWIHAAIFGCCRLQPDPATSTRLAKQVLVMAILSAGLAPGMTPPLVRGVRAATTALGCDDPVPAAWVELNNELQTQYSPADASQLIINTVVGLPEADRQAAICAILGIS